MPKLLGALPKGTGRLAYCKVLYRTHCFDGTRIDKEEVSLKVGIEGKNPLTFFREDVFREDKDKEEA